MPEHFLDRSLAAAEPGEQGEGHKNINEAEGIVHHQSPGIVRSDLGAVGGHQVGEIGAQADGATSIMMPTNFIMMSFRLASSLPMGLCSPPQAETQKPKRMAKMMRGSMLDLSHRSEKSDTVRELTSSSPAVCASPTSLATSSMVVPAEGLNRLTHTSTQTRRWRR